VRISKNGVLVLVGLFGNQTRIPLIPSMINEYQVQCSLWGNYNELCEVIESAKQGTVNNTVRSFSLNAINEAIRLLRSGQVDGRAVIIPK
jgi:propanol-preferring alcohol dehydrogenase